MPSINRTFKQNTNSAKRDGDMNRIAKRDGELTGLVSQRSHIRQSGHVYARRVVRVLDF